MKGEPVERSAQPARRPRILLLVDRVPGVQSGYGMRVQNVIDGLCAVGNVHVCLVDSSVAGEAAPTRDDFSSSRIRAEEPPRWRKVLRSMRVMPVHLRYRNHRSVREQVRRVVESDDWDLIWCSRMRMQVLSEGFGTAVRVVDFDDLGDRLMLSEIRDRTAQRGWLRSLGLNVHGLLDALRWRRLQRRTARSVAAVCVCSDDDGLHLGVANWAVVPNGYPEPVGDQDLAPPPGVGDGPMLLFVGPLSYEPNLLAVEWMATEVLPLLRCIVPGAQLVVAGEVGRAAARVRHLTDVTFAGWVPDVAPYYAHAALAVTPLRSGGGTRLKVIEALARSVPLVSTSFACDGLGLTAEEHLMVADDATAFADACARVLADPDLVECVTAEGRRRYEECLTAEQSCRAVGQLVTDLLTGARVHSQLRGGGALTSLHSLLVLSSAMGSLLSGSVPLS